MSTDWLVSLAQMVPVAGSYLSSAIQSIQDRKPNENVAGKVVHDWGTGLAHGFGTVGSKGLEGAGAALGMATEYDPTQLLTKPVMGMAHQMGLGAQGDQWDKGLLGITGSAFDKVGRLATFVALQGNADFGNTPVPSGLDLTKRAWDMAFSTKGQHVTFGEAALAGDRSILVDPNGLENFRKELKGTWYGGFVSGAITFGMYSALDPTKGVGAVAKAARADKYVNDAMQADRLAKTLNVDKLPATAAAGLDISPSLGAKAANMAKASVGAQMNDAGVVGHQWKAMGALDYETDINKIINHLDPMLGTGGTAPRSGIPAVAEMYADAARFTSDVTLQRQIKLNVQYALTGSHEAMNWLVQNVPQIAAKGRRVTFAPSEFTLLENAMQDFAAKGNVGGAFGGSMGGVRGSSGDFNLGDWVSRHYDDPVQQAELTAYGEAVQSVQRFKSQVWEGGPGGGPLDFGTAENGLQVAPRNLEKLKTAIHNSVLDEHLFQDGPSGRTMRIISAGALSKIDTPRVNGFISVADPVHGNKQLIATLKEFSTKVDGIDGAYIRQVSQRYLALDPAARSSYIRQVSDDLLGRVAAKHGMTEKQLKGLIEMSSKAYVDGREYASKIAKREAAAGNPNAYLGDLTGTDTVLGVQHLQSHLDDTVGIMDFKTADRVARSWERSGYISRTGEIAKDFALSSIGAYHTIWKHAQLGRVGLAARVLMDTDMRANAMIGSAALAMQSLNGAMNFARNRRAARIGSVYDTAASSMDQVLAARAASTAAELRAISRARASKIALRQEQAYKADALAESLMNKVYDEHGNLQGALSILYARRAASAKALANRLAGDTYTVGKTAPLGKQALLKEQADLGPAELRAASEQNMAARHYLGGQTKTKQHVVNTPQTHEALGVQVAMSPVHSDLEWSTLADDVRDSGAGLSDLLLSNVDHKMWKGRVEKGQWQDHVDPTDLRWPQQYAKSVQLFRESYTARRLLAEGGSITDKTPEAIFKSFINDPAVLAEFRNTMGGGTREDLARWLADLTTSIRSMTPTESLRARLLNEKVLTPAEVEKLIPQGERFPIFGPNVVRRADGAAAVVNSAMDVFYKNFVDMPDVYLARVPAYNGLYHRAVDRLLPGAAAKARAEGRDTLTAEEMVALHSRAKQQALNSVHRDMYDMQRTVGSHGVVRYLAPFFNPWYDAMTSWARLIYDNPRNFGMLMRYSQTPDMYGITVDRDGNRTNPWDGTSIQDKGILVPMFGLGGQQHFRLAFSSLNTIVQGNNPFSPGLGPLYQIGGTALLADVFPHVWPQAWDWMAKNPKNIISQTLFPRPGDVPKGDLKTLAGSQLPSYLRSMTDVIFGENGFGNTYVNAYGTRYNDLIRRYREDHGGADPTGADIKRLQVQASNAARASAATRAVASFGLGLSGNAAPQGQFYVDKMHGLVAMTEQLKQVGLTPEQVFAANYPSAANLNWKFSVNDGKLEATVDATSAYHRHKALMQANPEVMWWIAGPDNIMANLDPGNSFSQGAYNQQRTDGLRRSYSEQDLNRQANIEMAWGKVDQFNQSLALFMRQNGIEKLTDKNAGNLSQARKDFMDGIRAQYPDWARDQASGDAKKKRALQITQITNLVLNPPPALAERPDVQLTKQYLTARAQVIATAEANGVLGWDTAKSMLPLRMQLFAYGQQLAKDPVFSMAWTRLFSREFNDETQQALASVTQAGQ